MGRAHEVRAASMAKTAAIKSKLYGRYGKEIYIAAKSGVPDPDMNLALRAKIKEAKSNHVPADVIKRAIDRAKGGDNSNYDEIRYEGFGPNNSTVIVECLTDNTNRSLTEVRNAFNKSKGCKMASAGAVSFGYQRLGVFAFETSMSEDDLFGDFDDFGDFGIDEDDSFLGSTGKDFDSILGDTTLRDELNKTDDGSWQFILLKVNHPSQTNQIIRDLQIKFAQENLNVQVLNWKSAAYSYSGTVEGIGIVFNILIVILAVVVFIIIMNTMTVSVIERTSEIGTMRAIGAEKKFVRRLFFSESVMLTLGSSIIGIIFAIKPPSNELIQIL